MCRQVCSFGYASFRITEAKCLQISHNKHASQRDAISTPKGNLMLSHSAGMHNIGISIAGISKRFHFASLHCIFSAYLPTHIKFLTEFHRIFFGTTYIYHFLKIYQGISPHYFSLNPIWIQGKIVVGKARAIIKISLYL